MEASSRMALTVSRNITTRRILHQQLLRGAARRNASNTSSSNSKPIVLDKPDKFRPPSHGSRPKTRSTTTMYAQGAAYNQGMTAAEMAKSEKKSYPHMFPAEGTRMHWFLTHKYIHLVISMIILVTLAGTSMITTWAKTSPYAHLVPPINMLLFSPLRYLSEVTGVYKLHKEYATEQAAAARRKNVEDAQKRRLYRRAHGMEDLNADEISGVDVRGLVDWDDGLTNKERERGGQYRSEMMAQRMQEMGSREGESLPDLMERKRDEQLTIASRKIDEKARKQKEAEQAEEERLIRIGAKQVEEKRRPKLFFGIW